MQRGRPKKGKKGISPVISIVIMIAVAIATGVMLSTWVTQWVSRQTSDSSMACVIRTNYIIESANFNGTGDNLLVIKVTSQGAEGIYGFGVIIDNATDIYQFNATDTLITLSPNISITNKLQREGSVYIKLDMDTEEYSQLGATANEIRVTNTACNSVSAKTNVIAKTVS
jgi:flagellin-like protein